MASIQVRDDCFKQAIHWLKEGDEALADGFLREAARYYPLTKTQKMIFQILKGKTNETINH